MDHRGIFVEYFVAFFVWTLTYLEWDFFDGVNM